MRPLAAPATTPSAGDWLPRACHRIGPRLVALLAVLSTFAPGSSSIPASVAQVFDPDEPPDPASHDAVPHLRRPPRGQLRVPEEDAQPRREGDQAGQENGAGKMAYGRAEAQREHGLARGAVQDGEPDEEGPDQERSAPIGPLLGPGRALCPEVLEVECQVDQVERHQQGPHSPAEVFRHASAPPTSRMHRRGTARAAARRAGRRRGAGRARRGRGSRQAGSPRSPRRCPRRARDAHAGRPPPSAPLPPGSRPCPRRPSQEGSET